MKRLETPVNIGIPYGHRQIPANREALRARSGNVWSLYHTEAGRNIYLIQFFSAPEDIGHFCYEGELRFMRER